MRDLLLRFSSAEIAGQSEHAKADRGRKRVFDLAGKRHDGQHDTLHTRAGLIFDIIHRLGLHLLLDEVLELHRDGEQTGEQHNKHTGEMAIHAVVSVVSLENGKLSRGDSLFNAFSKWL